MKKLYTLFLLINAVLAFAQPPKLINYQGVLRRSNGEAITDTIINIRFDISGVTPVYTEDQLSVQVNNVGLFTTQIGKNAVLPSSWSSTAALTVSMFDGNVVTGLGGAQQIASVPFALNAPSPNVSVINNTLLTVGSSTAALPASAGLQSLTAVPGGSLSITNGNTVNVWPNLIGGGNTTVTPIASGYSVSSSAGGGVKQGIIPSTGQSLGLAQIFGTAPNQTVVVAPDIGYNQTNGKLTLANKNNNELQFLLGLPIIPAPATYTFEFSVTPSITISNGILQSGPPTNTVILDPYIPWRSGTPGNTLAAVARLVQITHSVGIGVDSPNSKLHVDGFTKLGDSAPAIQVMTVSATTANAVNGAITVALPSYMLSNVSTALTTNKVIAVTVMVQTTNTSDWVPPGHTALSGAQYNWHMNNTNGIVITNSALATNILSAPVKITVTYMP